MKLGIIVEGHGDVSATPALVRNYLAATNKYVDILTPVRVTRSKMIGRFDDVERAVRLLAYKEAAAILLLADEDDDCAGIEGPALVSRMQTISGGRAVAAVFACKEFEGWFLAGIESLRGRRRLPQDASFAGDSEAKRGAKEHLGHLMTGNAGYSETLDQAALAAVLDLQTSRKSSRSLDKLLRDLDRLIP